MNKKQLWQKLFSLSKYSDYKVMYENDEEILLVNEKSNEVIRIILTIQSGQKLTFLVEKIEDNYEALCKNLNMKIKKIHVFLFNQHVPLDLNNSLITVYALDDTHDFSQLQLPLAMNVFNKRQTKLSVSQIKSRIINKSFIDHAMNHFAPLTYLLIIINILIYFINYFFSSNSKDFISEGGLTHFNFIHGDYHRIITSMFLHFDFSHILFNMFALLLFGKLIEYLYGLFKMLIIYIGSGLLGNLLSLSFDTSSISAGASGAISGLTGGFLVYLIVSQLFEKKFIIQTAIGLILFLLMSNLFSKVNNFAHFGGMFGGFLIALLFYLWRSNRRIFVLSVLGSVVIIFLILINIFKQPENHIYNTMAYDKMSHGNFADAKIIVNEVIKKGYENDETYLIHGLIEAHDHSLNEAIVIWEKGLKKYPHSSILNFQMALGMRANDDYNSSMKYLNKAKKNGESQLFSSLEEELKVFTK